MLRRQGACSHKDVPPEIEKMPISKENTIWGCQTRVARKITARVEGRAWTVLDITGEVEVSLTLSFLYLW
jgi:hypothetical protein